MAVKSINLIGSDEHAFRSRSRHHLFFCVIIILSHHLASPSSSDSLARRAWAASHVNTLNAVVEPGVLSHTAYAAAQVSSMSHSSPMTQCNAESLPFIIPQSNFEYPRSRRAVYSASSRHPHPIFESSIYPEPVPLHRKLNCAMEISWSGLSQF